MKIAHNCLGGLTILIQQIMRDIWESQENGLAGNNLALRPDCLHSSPGTCLRSLEDKSQDKSYRLKSQFSTMRVLGILRFSGWAASALACAPTYIHMIYKCNFKLVRDILEIRSSIFLNFNLEE